MAKLSEWSGNATAVALLPDNETKKLNSFLELHKAIYIFGAGKIGTGFKNYLERFDILPEGFVTSDTLSEFKRVYKYGETGLIMGLSDKNLSEALPLVNGFVSDNDLFIADSQYRERVGCYTAEYLRDNLSVTIKIVNHCNLNCKGCAAFSPVACEEFYEYDEIKKDLGQLNRMNLQIKSISFTGGEPFLHPELFKIFRVARSLFPNITIECCTNGTLLSQLNDAQLEEFVELGVIIRITIYPKMRRKVDSFCNKADKLGANYNIISYEGTKYFTPIKLTLNKPSAKGTVKDSSCSSLCYFGINLFKGKIFKCQRPALIHHLNNYFNTNFIVSEQDFLDLYSTSPEEIYKFKISRVPFCDYHDSADYELVEWGLSERKIEEWVNVD